MRACNGCRKRKIKCDAATTNTWPCSACTRLKLVCVPPTIGQDGDFLPDGQGESTMETGGPSNSVDGHNFPVPPVYRDNSQPMNTMPSYEQMSMYSQFVPPQAQPAMYNDLRSPPMAMPPQAYQQSQMYTGPQTPSMGTSDRGLYVDNDQSTAENLSEVLGELKIDETGIGMEPSLLASVDRCTCGVTDPSLRLKLHILEDNGQIGLSPMLLFRMRLKSDCLL